MSNSMVSRAVKSRQLLLSNAISLLILLAVALISAGSAAAGEGAYFEPVRGSQERKAIMNAARAPISAEIGSTVIFMVDILRTDGRMAYLQGTPINPDSSPLDWNNTPFRDDWNADMMSDVVMVLLEKQNGRWTVLDYVIGPTDVFWYGWLEKYGLPEALFNGG